MPSPAPGPAFTFEDKAQVKALFKKWDDRQLLSLVPGPLPREDLTRIFCAVKDRDRDRQIGDRRNVNNQEARLCNGPSAVFCLRDFYGAQALSRFLARADSAFISENRGPCGRLPSSVLVGEVPVHGAFRSLLQGDHAGVEFACSGHEGLLQSVAVLPDPSAGRLLSKCPVATRGPWSGLIIDDLFSISVEEVGAATEGFPAQSEVLLRRAKVAYDAEGILGSDHKDQFSALVCTVAGAQVDASAETVASGCVLVGLPASRRLALSHVSLQVAAGRWISEQLASALAGSWVTALMYRRPLMAAIGALFELGKRAPLPGGSLLRHLGPAARQDLVLLSVLAPLMVSNVAAPTSCQVGVSDASSKRGATCSAAVPQDVAEHLWQTSDQRGWYSRLNQGPDDADDVDLHDGSNGFKTESNGKAAPLGSVTMSPCRLRAPPPERPVACSYDFLEVRGGGPWLSCHLPASLSVGPVLDHRRSPHFSLLEPRCLEWVLHLIQERRLGAVCVMPPVGSFSPAFKPRLRSWDRPSGLQPTARLLRENALLSRALAVLLVASRCNTIGILLHPLLSFGRGLPSWRCLSSAGVQRRSRWLPVTLFPQVLRLLLLW